MPTKRPTTIGEYIQMAPAQGQPHLRALYAILKSVAPNAILKSVAPNAEEAIKWNTPFFVEPRFLFAFAAHKAHLSFAATPAALDAFRDALATHKTTKNYLQLPYNKPLPEALIRQAPVARSGGACGRWILVALRKN